MSAVVEPVRHKLSSDDFERLGAAGILAEYWIVEVEARHLHVLRSPVPGEGVFTSMGRSTTSGFENDLRRSE